MKKDTFTAVMIAEVLADLLSMGLLFSDMGAIIYPISLAIFAAALAPFYLRMKKVPEEKKRKLRLWMVLVMLLPMVAALVAIGCVVLALVLYYGF